MDVFTIAVGACFAFTTIVSLMLVVRLVTVGRQLDKVKSDLRWVRQELWPGPGKRGGGE